MKKRTFHITVLLLFVAVLPSYAAPPQQQTQPSDLEVLSAFENAIAKVVDISEITFDMKGVHGREKVTIQM